MKVILSNRQKILTEETKFPLDEISKIENYFHQEINQKNHAVKD